MNEYDALADKLNLALVINTGLHGLACSISNDTIVEQFSQHPVRVSTSLTVVAAGMYAAGSIRKSFLESFSKNGLHYEGREELNTSGARELVRHPMYSCYGASCIGWFVDARF